ncbi:MAG: hypothetical protein JO033_28185, partial [Acidobacteriaceae bacterium]|nr:hypothetical protein [Acidobacteriaceae bacterium]
MNNHLSRKQLLLHLDREQPKSAARKTSEHLQLCAACTRELDCLKDELAAIVDTQVELIEPLLPSPPVPWPALEPRPGKLPKATAVPLWQSLVPSLGSALKWPLAYGGAVLTVVLIALLVWTPVSQLSAHEVIQRATVADTQRLAITPREVVRQRVLVKKTERRAPGTRTGQLESWKSAKSIFWDADADPLNTDLLNRYKANGLALYLPLSPPALESWLKLAGSEPSASREAGKIDIQVASNAQGRARGLEEFSFRVEPRDWHVDEMTLSFEDAIFQIDEEDSSILNRSEVPSAVLARLEPPESTYTPTRARALSRGVSPAINLNDLEMAVRYDLHRLKADLGENIEITRHPPAELAVNASGVSADRKKKLAATLANKPGVHLELQAPVRTGTAGPGTTITTARQPARQPPDQRLITFFGDASAEENYTRSVLGSSTDILAHLYALKELANRWPPGQDANLSSTAKAQLAAMVRDHARDIQAGVSQLKPQVDFFLKGFGHQV